MGRDSSGYAKKPLPGKLGIKDGFKVAVLNAPPYYRKKLGEARSVVVEEALPGYPLDFIQFFAVDRRQLESEFPRLRDGLTMTGMLWISWPKRSSGVKTDLSDRFVREIGLRNGLVDVKVAAVDETWSGLKFVRRLEDRR
jgi:hypothetical protein